MKTKKSEEPPIVRAARAMQEAIDEIETLTSRSSKVELGSASELERAADILQKAEAKHREFLASLGAIATSIDELRARQNASASTLSQHAEQLETRRADYVALERRFAYLADSAQHMGAALAAGGTNGASGIAAMKEGVRGVRDRMAAAVDEARVLTVDAREAGFADLEKQAHAIRQQLTALLRKIDEALEG